MIFNSFMFDLLAIYAVLFSSVSLVPCSISFSCMLFLWFPLDQSFHMLVQTHAF